jgi:hypothetical protein
MRWHRLELANSPEPLKRLADAESDLLPWSSWVVPLSKYPILAPRQSKVSAHRITSPVKRSLASGAAVNRPVLLASNRRASTFIAKLCRLMASGMANRRTVSSGIFRFVKAGVGLSYKFSHWLSLGRHQSRDTHTDA